MNVGRPSLFTWVISAPLFSACGLLLPLDPDEPIDAALAVDASDPPDAQSPLDGGRPEAGPAPDAGLVDASVLDSSVPDGSVIIRPARSVSAGALHTCATVAGGDVFCWGNNGVGQLGDGTFTPRWSPAGVGIGDFIGGSSKHTCAIAGGDVSCWGDNAGGQLGDGTAINRPSPVSARVGGAMQLCGGDSHTCAVLAGGEVACWGSNARGAIGSGILGLRYRDAQIVPLIPSMAEVTCGAEHTCARSASGFAACWGRGGEGQLGEARMVDSVGPVGVRTVGGVYVTDIDAGGFHTCAVSSVGTVYCWGRGAEGQLGTGSRDGANVPALVLGITAAVEVSAAAAHTCARLRDGSVVCWGENGGGQLGTGDRLDRLAPGVPVVGLTDAIAISTGDAHSCALRSTGSLACWGLNGDGRLGDGSTRDSDVPVEVAWP